MKNKSIFILLALLFIAVHPVVSAEECMEEIITACEKAASENKLVLVVFGASWCPDCTALDTIFQRNPVREYFDSAYVLVHIDIGKYDKNIETANSYNVFPRNGIPAAVILNPKNLIVRESAQFRWSRARTLSDEQILNDLSGGIK